MSLVIATICEEGIAIAADTKLSALLNCNDPFGEIYSRYRVIRPPVFTRSRCRDGAGGSIHTAYTAPIFHDSRLVVSGKRL